MISKGCYCGRGCVDWCTSHIIGRVTYWQGAVVGANTLVNKEIPPYAVVVGSPAKIIAAKFTIDQIMEHERILYPEKSDSPRNILRNYLTSIILGKDDRHQLRLGKTNLEQFKNNFISNTCHNIQQTNICCPN